MYKILKEATVPLARPYTVRLRRLDLQVLHVFRKALPTKTDGGYITGSTSACQAASAQPVSKDCMPPCAFNEERKFQKERLVYFPNCVLLV